ncbi:MAG: haloacid dehalogenase type II [Burkholderiaceae bacterium]|nr:haloacid dehalogenase type II [Burkholderiaceae bacterium]MCD8516326.1 haloacid dehalogenase type II [Burkholderiaceae bacterium]MCD8538274.1 haloacid dehalogenase type II [Burkholderiaceae bacterium]
MAGVNGVSGVNAVGGVRALLFDVFGSVVDWRGSIARDLTDWGQTKGINIDWESFARAWRSHYQPKMQEVRSGQRDFTLLDQLHREALDVLLPAFGINDLTEADKAHINLVWHRLDAWPDSIAGLGQLKAKYTVAPLSNGNVALLNNMAKHAGLPWDLNLSTQWFKAYKPQPQTYLGAVSALGLQPHEVMMCAAHNDDLLAARACGLKTAFWPRPHEYGVDQVKDFSADHDWDVIATDIRDLARQML